MPIFKRKKPAWRRFIDNYRVPGVLVLLLLLMIIFWGNISWFFNGEVWRQLLSDYFPQYFPKPYVMVEHKPAIEPVDGGEAGGGTIIEDPVENTEPNVLSVAEKKQRDLLSIPKLGLAVPIITTATADSEVIYGLLDSGVVLYPGSAPFGDAGQTVILGHSAPTGWPKIKYDWVFSRINELVKGDMVIITYNDETRYYSVVTTRVVTPQEGVPQPTVEGNSLALVSCWPPGKDLKRIIVESTINTD